MGKNSEEVKQTNEIKIAGPLLDAIDIENKDITADALHTQRKFARYIVQERKAHYYLTVKENQANLLADISFYFQNNRTAPESIDITAGEHGRIETRKIWTTSELNAYLEFPHVGQTYAIEREFINKRTGEVSSKELVYGITSRKREEADAGKILKIVRGHWSIENSCHYILDWNYDEDRCRIRTGYGPENITRLRKFAISVIKSKKAYSVAQKMRKLSFRVRMVFDYLKMTEKFQQAIND